MPTIKEYDVVVIGAGQCGLSLAYYLEKKNISYIVLEKDRAFSVWYKRWDNFNMNTANWMNSLPGLFFLDDNKRSNKVEIVTYFEQWLTGFTANIQISCVRNIKLDGKKYIIESDNTIFNANALVFAIGLNKIKIPEIYKKLPIDIPQLHSSKYRQPGQINTSNVLIVGTGSSGVQICEDLAKTNKYSIILSCSKNKYFSWNLFGLSIYSYVKYFRLFDIRSHSLLGKIVTLLSKNKGDPATPPSPETLQSLYGVELKDRLIEIKEYDAFFENNKQVNLKNTTIIWCTGYQVDILSIVNQQLRKKLIDDRGFPILQSDFQSTISNAYFIGLRFQRLVSSHIIYGAIRDAKYLASEISRNFKK